MGTKESVAEANKAFRKNGNGNGADTEITLTKQAPPITEAEKGKALLLETLRRRQEEHRGHRQPAAPARRQKRHLAIQFHNLVVEPPGACHRMQHIICNFG